MTDFDKDLKALLSAEDETFVTKHLGEEHFYSEVLGTLKGQGRGFYLMTWAAILIFGFALLYCIWMLFQVQTTRELILFGVFAILLNSAQIALKLWFNMRLNRRAIITEMKRLHLAVARIGG